MPCRAMGAWQVKIQTMRSEVNLKQSLILAEAKAGSTRLTDETMPEPGSLPELRTDVARSKSCRRGCKSQRPGGRSFGAL